MSDRHHDPQSTDPSHRAGLSSSSSKQKPGQNTPPNTFISEHLYFQKNIGDYRIVKKIGKGRYGLVKLGERESDGLQVAIKIVNKHRLNLVENDAIRTEAEVMTYLSHPHVVKLFEVIETPAEICMIMQYAAGGDLFEYIQKKKRLKEKEARRLFLQVLDGVGYCHKHYIVHRDIKAENIFLDGDKNVLIGDWGFSTIYHPGSKIETNCGSLDYAAPEVLSGTATLSFPVDVWSLGVLLYFMVSGTLPFQAANDFDIYQLIKKAQFRSIKHNVSDECKDLVSKILDPDPTTRPSIDQLLLHPWCLADGGGALRRSEPTASPLSMFHMRRKSERRSISDAKIEASMMKVKSGTDEPPAERSSASAGAAGSPKTVETRVIKHKHHSRSLKEKGSSKSKDKHKDKSSKRRTVSGIVPIAEDATEDDEEDMAASTHSSAAGGASHDEDSLLVSQSEDTAPAVSKAKQTVRSRDALSNSDGGRAGRVPASVVAMTRSHQPAGSSHRRHRRKAVAPIQESEEETLEDDDESTSMSDSFASRVLSLSATSRTSSNSSSSTHHHHHYHHQQQQQQQQHGHRHHYDASSPTGATSPPSNPGSRSPHSPTAPDSPTSSGTSDVSSRTSDSTHSTSTSTSASVDPVLVKKHSSKDVSPGGKFSVLKVDKVQLEQLQQMGQFEILQVTEQKSARDKTEDRAIVVVSSKAANPRSLLRAVEEKRSLQRWKSDTDFAKTNELVKNTRSSSRQTAITKASSLRHVQYQLEQLQLEQERLQAADPSAPHSPTDAPVQFGADAAAPTTGVVPSLRIPTLEEVKGKKPRERKSSEKRLSDHSKKKSRESTTQL